MAEEALKPGEWEKILTWIEKLLGFDIPYWVKLPLALLLFLALVVSIILIVVAGVSKIQELWVEKIAPRVYNPEQKLRSRSRRLFAQHLAREIGNINAGENWRDDEFTEAEVEAEVASPARNAQVSLFASALCLSTRSKAQWVFHGLFHVVARRISPIRPLAHVPGLADQPSEASELLR